MKKWRKNIFSAIAFTSFFLVLGSVGAMEHDTVSFWQGAGQASFFMASLIFFTYLEIGDKKIQGKKYRCLQKGRGAK